MQLLSTQQYYRKLTIEDYKNSLLIDKRKSPVRFLPIDYLRFKESSIFLQLQKDIKSLAHLYIFINPDDIKRFLLNHDYLINTLFEVHNQIRRVFGANIIEICLEYDKDPEENFEGLFVTVKTNLFPEQSLDLLEKFDEEWWLTLDFQVRNKITVMVRPV